MNELLAALLNGILISAVLALLVGITLQLLPARLLNASTRYAIWWIVLAITVALPLSYIRIAENGDVPRTAVAHAISVPATLATEPSLVAPKPEYVVGTLPAPEPVPRLPTATFPLALSAGPWPGRIMTIWLVTACFMLIRLARSAILLQRRKACATDAPVILAARIGHSIRVVVSSEISIPLVAGPWKPCIMFPARLLDELDEHELEQIGIHEVAHLLRGDDYALLIQRTLEALFALHPVLRWVSRRIDMEREVACDDLVIAATGDPLPYAACLIRVVQITGGIRATPIATSAADRSHLARRVDLLLDNTRHLGTHLLGIRLALATICLAAMSWGAVKIPEFFSFAATPPRAPQQTPAVIQAPMPLLAQADRPPIPAAPQPVPPPATSEPAAPVLVSIVVRDPLGRFVTGLDQSTFKIREDGVEQVTSQLADSDDRADLFVVVGAEVNPDPTLQPLLAEKVEVSRSVDIVQVHGLGQLQPDTSPLTAILAVANRLRYISKRQAVLLVTNSATATEHYTDADLQNTADIDMPVYVFDLSGTSPFFQEIALRTGGDYIPVRQQQEIPDLLSKTVIAVLNEYVLTYTPTNTARDGAYRSLQVTLEQPRGLPPLTVHYPAGYIAPTR